jgi:hypothetical protein
LYVLKISNQIGNKWHYFLLVASPLFDISSQALPSLLDLCGKMCESKFLLLIEHVMNCSP